MNYAIAVGIYIVFYILGSVMPLFLGSVGSVIQLVIYSIPILLVGPRVAQRFTDGQPLVPKEVRSEGGLLYGIGTGLIWLGHLVFFGAIGIAIYITATASEMVPIGILAGYALFPYLVGIVLVELAFRQWSKRQLREPWKWQQNSIRIVVGLIVSAQIVFNLTSDRPVDLLSYDEREALAWGNMYSREVKRKAEQFYIAEKRMPCVDDEYADVDSLLRGSEADRSKALSIQIFDCGRIVATIHRPIDGVSDGQLLFVASPGDADAGTPLEWQCFSPQLKRIERHTNGRCTYDPSLAGTIPAPAVAQRTVTPERSSTAVVVRPPSIQSYLDRLAEPTLWENCGEEVTSYRLLKFDAGQYVASVRVSRESRHGEYRTATSSKPGTTKSLDGFVEEKTWNLIESRFDAADFWSLRTKPRASRSEGNRIYVEGCRDGRYHAVERESHDMALAPIVRTITVFGKLEWLEGG